MAFIKAADSYQTAGMGYIVLVDEHTKQTYVAAILQFVGVDNSSRIDHKGLISCTILDYPEPICCTQVLHMRHILDLHDSGLIITGSIWEECFNHATEESMTVVALTDYWYIPSAEDNVTQNRICIEDAGLASQDVLREEWKSEVGPLQLTMKQ